MSGGKSSSNSSSTTKTTTNQTDARVAAADMGVAIGQNATVSGLTIQQIPAEVAAFADKLFEANAQLVNIATAAGEQAIEQSEESRADSGKRLEKIVIIAVVAMVVIVIAMQQKRK